MLIIAADTAMVKEVDNKLYRLKEHYRKLIQIDNLLIFMSGSVDIANDVIRKFKQTEQKTVQKLQEIVIESSNYFSKMYPDIFNEQNKNIKRVAILAAEWKDKATQVHTIQPSDDFQIHTFLASKSETIPHAGGFFAEKASDMIGTMLDEGNKTAPEMIKTVYDSLSGAEVGGNLIIAILNNEGIFFVQDQPIPEVLRLPYYEDLPKSAFLIGSHIQTSAPGQYPRAEMSTKDQMFKVGASSSNSIEIRALGDPISIPDLQFKTGSAKASISLPSSATGLYMNGERLTAEFMEIKLRGYNGVSVTGWDRLQSEESGSSLQNELDNTAYNMTFDSATRNLKLWSRSGQLLAQVNI
jgi:hypothetical protein